MSVYLILEFQDQRSLPALYLDPVALLLGPAAVPVNLSFAQQDPQYIKFSISPFSPGSGSHRSWGRLLRILSAVEYSTSWSLGEANFSLQIHSCLSLILCSDSPGEDDAADTPLLRVPESPAQNSLLDKAPVIKWTVLARLLAAAVTDSLDKLDSAERHVVLASR